MHNQQARCEEREAAATLSRPCTNRPVSYLKEESALHRREHFLSDGVRKRQRVRTICREKEAEIFQNYVRLQSLSENWVVSLPVSPLT